MAALFAITGVTSTIFGWRCWRSCADLRQPERTLVPAFVGLLAGSGAAFSLFVVAAIVTA